MKQSSELIEFSCFSPGTNERLKQKIIVESYEANVEKHENSTDRVEINRIVHNFPRRKGNSFWVACVKRQRECSSSRYDYCSSEFSYSRSFWPSLVDDAVAFPARSTSLGQVHRPAWTFCPNARNFPRSGRNSGRFGNLWLASGIPCKRARLKIQKNCETSCIIRTSCSAICFLRNYSD